MKLSKKSVLLTIPAALTIAFGAAAATGNHGDWGARRIERLKQELGLSDDQATKIRSAFTAQGDQRKQLFSDLRQAMSDYKTAALNEDGTLPSKRAAVLDVQGKMLDLRGAELAKIGSILTPAQRTQFAGMKHGGRGHWHHGHGAPSDQGPEDSPAAE
jgi:Spy/CpxP family protein refolding chaperone